MNAGQFPGAPGKFAHGKLPKMFPDQRPIIGKETGKRNFLIRKTKVTSVIHAFHAQEGFFSPKKKRCSCCPWLVDVTRPFVHLFQQPRFASFQKTKRLGLRTAPGYDQARLIPGSKTKKIPPSPGLPYHMHRDPVLPKKGLIPADARLDRRTFSRWSRLVSPKPQIKLQEPGNRKLLSGQS